MATKPTLASQAAEIAELRARIEALETSLTTKLEEGLTALLPRIEKTVQAALDSATGAGRTDVVAARPIAKTEAPPRPEGYTAWQNDARCQKLRARGFDGISLAYKAGGFVKARLQDGSVHDTTVSKVSEYLAGQAATPF